MTASGNCSICGVVCGQFHYFVKHEPGREHDGYWHCPDHGPGYSPKDEVDTSGPSQNVQPEGPKLNREQRRRLQRHLAKIQRKGILRGNK